MICEMNARIITNKSGPVVGAVAPNLLLFVGVFQFSFFAQFNVHKTRRINYRLLCYIGVIV